MKRALLVLSVVCAGIAAEAASTISSVTSSNSAWSGNLGWVNWKADGTNGAIIGEFVCSGAIYSPNVGWISLGSGNPQNGIRYSNSGNDFGVNHDGEGSLRGYAYGANIGWIAFEQIGNPRVSLVTGNLSGHAWSANTGWISLSNTIALVKTDSLPGGRDTDGDNIPDAWELTFALNLNVLSANGDADRDGLTDSQEYLSDTNPLNSSSNLRISSHSITFSDVFENHNVQWNTRPTRGYRITYRDAFSPRAAWTFGGHYYPPAPGPSMNKNVGLLGPAPQRYLRVEAVRPLSN